MAITLDMSSKHFARLAFWSFLMEATCRLDGGNTSPLWWKCGGFSASPPEERLRSFLFLELHAGGPQEIDTDAEGVRLQGGPESPLTPVFALPPTNLLAAPSASITTFRSSTAASTPS